MSGAVEVQPLPAEDASRAVEWNLDEESKPVAHYQECWDRELAEANAPGIAATVRLCCLADAGGSLIGMMVYPAWAYLSQHDPVPFLTMYEQQSWALIPQLTNIFAAALGFVVFALPQLKGFVTHNYR